MQIAPYFMAFALSAWLFLAGLGWAVAALVSGRDPQFLALAAGAAAGLTGVGLAVILGGRGGASLLLSFPSAFLASFLASLAVQRLARRGGPRRSGRGTSS